MPTLFLVVASSVSMFRCWCLIYHEGNPDYFRIEMNTDCTLFNKKPTFVEFFQ
jgi:hypothetical protein